MKVIMKAYEKQAIDNAIQYKSWELQCVAKDAYLKAYIQAIVDLKRYFSQPQNLTSNTLNDFIIKEVEVEFTDGEHQLIDDIKRI